ncbi:hypothetical protein [Candidatus Laterigemmans baculatus]|uniref:hypothetical protein n=1 Tax=Candidatus Laterigemmans baculatus TaxID=2770505 RepID=UPI0013D9E000|nr:hypothetical protein [Candidatus Laterigemmans baculatus]
MLTHIDETRKAWLKQIARKIFIVVALIAIAGAIDLVPGKIAELSVWLGAGLFLLAAVSPPWLLERVAGQPITRNGAEGNT